MKFLKRRKIQPRRYAITELDNFFGKEVIDPKAGIEAIVVSEKTIPGARGINMLREDRGLKPLEIVEVALIKAKDGNPISSRRIRADQIDSKGNLKG